MTQVYTISGITGNVGSKIAQILLSAGHKVRGIVRNIEADSSKKLAAQGVELYEATFLDVAGLTKAFAGANGVFVMTPPENTSEDPEKQTQLYAEALSKAVSDANVGKAVVLSSVAAHLASGTGVIAKLHHLETAFKALTNVPVAILRAGYFAENTLGALGPAVEQGVVPYLVAPEAVIPIVSTLDIATQASKLLQEQFTGLRIIEFEGPQRLSHADVTQILSELLNKPLQGSLVPREARASIMESFGFGKVGALRFAELTFAIEDGIIQFEGGHESVKGTQTYKEFLTPFIKK